MTVPEPWIFVLLGLAAFRTFKLLSDDVILDWPRKRSLELAFKLGGPKLKTGFEDYLACSYCLGFLSALGWWGAWQLWEHATLVVAVPFALSALVVAADHFFTSE